MFVDNSSLIEDSQIFELEMKITNRELNENLRNSSSPEYETFTSGFCSEVFINFSPRNKKLWLKKQMGDSEHKPTGGRLVFLRCKISCLRYF